jgi:inhibitor of cysteine peptidase
MRTTGTILAALLAATVSWGCATAQEASVQVTKQEVRPTRLTAKDSGRRLELRVGDRFTLELRANLSTGYSWKVVSSGEPVIRLLGEPTYTEDSRMAGAGGTVTYEFRAEQTGAASLELVYARPWEKDAKPAETFSLAVAVAR